MIDTFDYPLVGLVPDEEIRTDPPAFDLGDADGIAEALRTHGDPPPDRHIEPVLFEPVEAHHPVAFGRVLRYRTRQMQGRDVLAVERALHLHHYMWKDADQTFGWRTRDSIELFQRHHNQNPDGVYDEPVHNYLAPLFDGYSDWLYTHAAVTPTRPDATPQQRLMHALWYLYGQRPWWYHASRPFLLYGFEDRIGYAFDCSWLMTETCFLAKLPDPNGYGYRGGQGNTESLRAHGTRVDHAQPGDMFFYGYYGSWSDPAHVAMCCNEAGNKCIGFGQSGGPNLNWANYRTIREIRRYV